MANRDVVLNMWKQLSDRNWDALGSYLSDDCIYLDMPVGPIAAARGPVDIVKRLKIGLEPLASYENFDGTLVSEGDVVMYEHSETWVFESGERVELPFVSVHQVRDGKISLWKDYWDFGAVANAAPPGWLEGLASADMSWMFDATGLV